MFVIYESTIPENLLVDLNIDNDFIEYIRQIENEKYCTIIGSESSRKRLYLNFCKYLRKRNRNTYNIWYIEVDKTTNWRKVWDFIKDGGGTNRYFIIENCSRTDELLYDLFEKIKNHSNRLNNEIFLFSSNEKLQYNNWPILELSTSDDLTDPKSFRYCLQNTTFEERINRLLYNRLYKKSRTEKFIDDLVPAKIKKEKFSQSEIFVLLYGIYLRDICKSNEKSTFEEIYNEITGHYDTYYLDEVESRAIAEICCAKEEDISSISENVGMPSLGTTIDLRFLAAIFRLGDIFDNLCEEYYGSKNIITYILTEDPEKIQFQTNPSSWNDLVKLTLLKDDVQSEFEKISIILNKRKLPKYTVALDKNMQNIADKIKKNLRNKLKDELKHFHSQVEGWSYSAIQEEKGIHLKNLDSRRIDSHEEKGIGRGTYYLLFIYYPENIGIHFEIMISVHEDYDRIGIELHMEGVGLHANDDTKKFFEELYEEKKTLGLEDDNFRRHNGKFRGLGEWIEGRFFKDRLDVHIVRTMAGYINKLKPIIDEKYFKK